MQNLIKTLKKYDVFVYILAILLLLLIASFSFSHTGVTNSPETTLAAPTNSDNWQDSASYRDTSWSGSGTSGSPYLITSAQELAGLAYRVNSGTNYSGTYFRQTQDIDLSAHYWTPIGNSERRFQGNFNGDYYNISGLYVNTSSTNYVGLFSYIENASISNLSLTSGSILGNHQVGGIAGRSNNSSIQNCISDISIEGYGYTGGIVGYSDGSDILSCASLQAVFGNWNYIGGVVGQSVDSVVNNCYNTAGIYATSVMSVGGIIGDAMSTEIKYCINYSTIISTEKIGGIAGETSFTTVSCCTNEGNILADKMFGGIVGRFDYSQINDCYNSGDMLCLGMGPNNDDVYVGGILGYVYQNGYNINIYNCYNSGEVSASYGNYLGGIVGYSSRSIYNCFNLGEVYTIYGTQSTAGEIAGSSRRTYNCYTSSQSRPNELSWFTNTSNWYSSYYQWDFSGTWGLSSNYNNNYPYLRMLTYSVNYNLDETSSETLYCKWGTSYEFPVGATKDGYIFAGWTSTNLNRNYAKIGTSKANVYWDGSTTDASHFADLGSNGQTVTLTANWEEIQYDVQIEYNDGVTSNRTISNIPYLTVFNVPNPTRTAYNFAGWSSSNKDDTALVGDSATSCTTSWTSGTTKATFFSKLTSTDGRTVILTANWDPINYTIDFDLNGGTLSNPFSSYNTESTTTLPEPSKTGYTFTGWYCTASNGNWRVGTTYPAGTALAGMYGNVSFRATWRANTYTVTFDPQGGSVSPTTIQVTYDQTYGYHNNGVLPIPTRTDYVFGGWYTQPGNISSDKRTASSIYGIAGDSTLYAYWNETWNIYAEKPSGNGTTASPYLISEPEHLGWLSYEVARGRETTAVCRQTANISLEQSRGESSSEPAWYPIGTESYPFRGSYDGNGYSVEIGYYNFAFYADRDMFGLFGYTNGARINKVYVRIWWTFAQITQTLNFNNIGTVIGYAKGNTVISNSAIYANIAPFFTGMRNSGVFIGYAESTVTITDCVVFRFTAEDPDLETVALSGGNPRIESCVYVINGVKGYTFTGYSDSTETNFVIADYLSAPVPAGLSWLAYGGERATLAEIKAWANS